MDDRKRKGGGGSRDKSKKKKYYMMQAHKGGGTGIQAGMAGVLITCGASQNVFAGREAVAFLDEYAEKLGYLDVESTDMASEEQGNHTIEEELEQELATLRKNAEKSSDQSHFRWFETGIKGLVFVQFRQPDKFPVIPFATQIYRDIEITKKMTRNCIRMIPVETISHASMEAVKKSITPLIEQKFTPNNPLEFAINFKRRGEGKILRDDFIDTIAGGIAEPHKVSLTNPNIVIIAEVFRAWIGLSIVPDCKDFKNFNLRTLAGEISPQQPNQTKQNEEKQSKIAELEKGEDFSADKGKDEDMSAPKPPQEGGFKLF